MKKTIERISPANLKKLKRIAAMFMVVITIIGVVTTTGVFAVSNNAFTWNNIDSSSVVQNGSVYTITLKGNIGPDGFEQLTVKSGGNVVLNLNGHTIDANGSGHAIQINGGTLTITGNGTITGATDSAIYVENGSLTLNGCAITGNSGSFGGGINLKDANLVINSGSISNNHVGTNGGGIYAYGDTTIEMNGGTISSNRCVWGGGGICLDGGASMIMNSGSIENNTAESNQEYPSRGGGVAIDGSSIMVMNGGSIENNIVYGNGGGISVGYGYDSSVSTAGNLTINSGSVSHNSAEQSSNEHGGGIYAEGNSTVTINGNYTADYDDSTDALIENTISSQTRIENNTAYSNGGGICMMGNSTLYMYGGSVSFNRAEAGGGGIKVGSFENNVTAYIHGGIINGNSCHNEGGGVSIGGGCQGYIVGQQTEIGDNGDKTSGIIYITNNTVDDDTADWGGGGIFVCSGISDLENYTNSNPNISDPGNMLLQSALITNNTSKGFGGGVAGCSTGRIFANLGAIDNTTEIGVAIFGNTATAQHDENYIAKSYVAEDVKGTDKEKELDHLSGGTSLKSEDHSYSAGNRVFWVDQIKSTDGNEVNGFNDYFCALNTEISNNMLGGGTENWTGSSDGNIVDLSTNSGTESEEIVEASYLAGLNSTPSTDDIESAKENAKVFITGNTSGTHGGGILVNGVAVMGEIPDTMEVRDRLSVSIAKKVFDENRTQIDHPDSGFEFDVFDSNGNKIGSSYSVTTEANSEENTEINKKSEGLLTVTFPYIGANSEHVYFITEHRGSAGPYALDNTVYGIIITGGKNLSQSAGDLFNKNLSISVINKVKIVKMTLENNAFGTDANGNLVIKSEYATDLNSKLNEGIVVLEYVKGAETGTLNGIPNTPALNKDDPSDIKHYIDFYTGTDHAKTVDLNKLQQNGAFVNSEKSTIDISVTKLWKAKDAGNIPDEGVTFKLYRRTEDGTDVPLDIEPEITGTDTNEWTVTFKYLDPIDEDSNNSFYYVTEEYDPGESGTEYRTHYPNGEYALPNQTITNVALTDISGEKKWDEEDWTGNGASTSYRPSEITIRLLAGGNAVLDEYGQEVEKTVTANDGWSWTFEDLPEYECVDNEWKVINYSVSEDPVYTYTPFYSNNNYDVTNTLIVQSFEFIKVDSSDSNIKLEGAEFTLTPVGSDSLYTAATAVSDDNGEVSFSNIPVGNYTLTETAPPSGYWASNASVTVEVTANGELNLSNNGSEIDESDLETLFANTAVRSSLQFTKMNDLGDGLEGAVFELEPSSGAAITDTSDADGTVTFSDLAPGEYILSESQAPANYRPSAKEIKVIVSDDGEVTFADPSDNSSLTPGEVESLLKNRELTSATFTKTWIGQSTESVIFELHRKYEVVNPYGETSYVVDPNFSKRISLDGSADNNIGSISEYESPMWVANFADLEKYNEDGQAYVYYATELEVESLYTALYPDNAGYALSGQTITNVTKETMSVPFVKRWIVPAGTATLPSITIELLRNGSVIETKNLESVTLTNNAVSHEVRGSFDGLPVFDPNGQRYEYEVREQQIDDYTPNTIGDDYSAEGYTIINYRYSRSLEGTIWYDGDSTTADGERKTEEEVYADVTVELWYCNTDNSEFVKYDEILTDENGHYMFTDLPSGYYKVIVRKDMDVTHKDAEGADIDVNSNAVSAIDTTTGNRTAVISESEIDGNVVDEIYLPTDEQLFNHLDGYTSDSDNNYNIPHLDAGFIDTKTYSRSLEGTLWYDGDEKTADGERKDGEELYEDVLVELYKENEDGEFEKVGETMTDDMGHYEFTDLEPGSYKVIVLNDMDVTTKGADEVEIDVNSNAVSATDIATGNRTAVISESEIAGEVVQTIYLPTDDELAKGLYEADEDGNYNIPHLDAGFVDTTSPMYATFTFIKYSDSDLALEGATFTLNSSDGTRVAEVVSNSRGEVVFAQLEPGSYTLYESDSPNGYSISLNRIAVNVAEDGSVTFADLNGNPYTLAEVETLMINPKEEDTTMPGNGDTSNPNNTGPSGDNNDNNNNNNNNSSNNVNGNNSSNNSNNKNDSNLNGMGSSNPSKNDTSAKTSDSATPIIISVVLMTVAAICCVVLFVKNRKSKKHEDDVEQ